MAKDFNLPISEIALPLVELKACHDETIKYCSKACQVFREGVEENNDFVEAAKACVPTKTAQNTVCHVFKRCRGIGQSKGDCREFVQGLRMLFFSISGLAIRICQFPECKPREVKKLALCRASRALSIRGIG